MVAKINFVILGLKLFVFSLSASIQEIDLVETNQVYESELESGEMGYVFKGQFSPVIGKLFNLNSFADKEFKIEIVRQIDTNYASATDMSEVITNMGAHVFSIKKNEASETDCLVETKDISKFVRIASIFECELTELKDGNVDARITIGNKFARRF